MYNIIIYIVSSNMDDRPRLVFIYQNILQVEYLLRQCGVVFIESLYYFFLPFPQQRFYCYTAH